MKRLSIALLSISLVSAAPAPKSLAELKQAFQKPPDDARIMMRWWWFGPAVEKIELSREMQQMKAGGIGGFEVQPVYPLRVDGNYPYLSSQFLDALTFTGAKARELGLRMDLTLASGWPYGGPHIPITLASSKLRVDRVAVGAQTEIPMPKIGEGEKFIAAFLVPGDGRKLNPRDIQKLRGATGPFRIPDGSGERSVLFFIASRTRMQVKRPAMGAEGFVLDHYNRAAIDRHLSIVGDPLLRALAKTPPYAVFSDSLEVYNADWTDDFLNEFQRRRGYDLTPLLPALYGDIGEKTGDVRHDWGLTLTELAEERYLQPLRAWAKQHGTLFRSQTYGIPPVALSSNSLVDLPEGEGWHWRQFSATRWATSASHLYGKPVTSSETWTWLHSPVFRATPLDMKAEADLHFLEGVNQLIGHGWPYSPPEVGEPGWRFYAAAVFNAHNPWWTAMPDVTLYLQRISYLLRQGEPANDVAIYLPTQDAYAGFTLGKDSINQSMDGLLGSSLIPQVLDAGFNFDFIDDRALDAPGFKHRVLVLPRVQRMPAESTQKIEAFRKKGGIVVSGEPFHTDVIPDVMRAPEIGFVHRKLEFADVYFVANTANHPVRSVAVFRISDRAAAFWDPFTGAMARASTDNRVELNLAPYESRVIVFSKDPAPPARLAAKYSEPLDLSSGWQIAFAGSTAKTPLETLTSWTEQDGRRFYSGSAAYEKSFNLPVTISGLVYLNFGEGTPVLVDDKRAGPGMRAMLESPVREAAIVYVNGTRAGSVWHPPYEVEVSKLLRPGQNTLRIVVSNLAVNELAGSPLPDYKELTAKFGERFQAQDLANLQPLPSGLLGPIRLLFGRD